MCLFSKYFQHLLNGENLYELDINNYHKIDNNIFTPSTNLSSNWRGTCVLIENIYNFKNIYSNNISILNTTIDSNSCSTDLICHKNTKYYYEITKQKIEKLKKISTISSAAPSGSINLLTPNYENEFSNLSDNKTLGGLIYDIFHIKLNPIIDKLDEIQNTVNNFISDNNIENELISAYNNIINFDKTIASASSIMINNFLNDKKMILNFFNFMFLFITSGYLITWVCVFIFFIVYECKKYKHLYYFLISFVNLMLLLAIWEIVLSGIFIGIRLFCRESPRVMKFLFTGDYIINGNTEKYHPKFGNKDPIQTELFNICLNGDGNLFQKYVSMTRLNSILNQTEKIKIKTNDLFQIINEEINYSNILTNTYNNYNNYSYIYSSILKLEEMYNNLYLVSDNFGNDNIRNIINNIRNNLDNYTCGMNYEYFVIKKEDCPRYSIILNQISNSFDNIYHCYIIQDLISSSSASYSGSGCNNDYINKAITFIKEINNLLKNRINQLKEIQNNYIFTWNYMHSEINLINNLINNIEYLFKDEINNKYLMGNCSSIKFDLIDFSEYISKKIGYKIKIMIIFSALSGILGFSLFYCILLILNRIKSENFIKYKDDGYHNYFNYNYNEINNDRKIKKSKLRKIKSPNIIKSDDDFQNGDKYIDNENNNEQNYKEKRYWDINDINMNKNKTIYNNVRKIEMKNLEKKNK